MKRFVNQPLPAQPRIAVIANDAIGGFVSMTPLLQMMRAKYPSAHILYCGGVRTKELSDASDLMDSRFDLHGATHADYLAFLSSCEPCDLVFNSESTPMPMVTAGVLAGEEGFVCGPCMGAGGRDSLAFADDERGALWQDKKWICEDVTERFPFLTTGFIIEIFCRLAYLEGPIPRYKVPSAAPGIDVPDVLITTAASYPSKLWTTEKWVACLSALRDRGCSVGLLGAPPKFAGTWKGGDVDTLLIEQGLVQDLRGKLSLPQVVGACALAKQILTIDNGIAHLATSTDTPIAAIFRNGIDRLWAPRGVPNLTVIKPPTEDGLPADISVETVLAALKLG